MIDKKIRPIYADPWFGLYGGDAMDITGKHLDQPIIRYWLWKEMESGRHYQIHELINLVIIAHMQAGGLRPTLKNVELEPRFRAAVGDLVTEGWAQYSVGKVKGSDRELWVSVLKGGTPPEFQEKTAPVERQAEVTIGTGPETVYGWYLPAYRQLATHRGEVRFPMKVGMTTGDPDERIRNHLGTAPEKYALGFVWEVDHAHLLEKWLHIRLTLRKLHMPDALGQEWFRTTPDELREIVRSLATSITGKEDSHES